METPAPALPLDSTDQQAVSGAAARFRLGWVVAVGGGILMALEILASRVLAPHFGSSVYVWGSIISVFLAALSLGYVWGGRLADRDPTLGGLGRQVAWAALTQGVLIVVAKPAVAWLAIATGHSTWGTLVATTVLFGWPSVMLGVISPYAVRLAAGDHARLGVTVGSLYALSTAGSLVGTLGCTFLLVPFLSLDRGLALLLFLTGVTSLIAIGPSLRRHLLPAVAVAATLVLAIGAWTRTHQLTGGLLATQMTAYQTIEVRDRAGVRTLTSNGFTHGGMNLETGDTALSYPRMAAGALLLQPEVESMLVLGTGAGFAGTHLQRFLPEMVIDFVDIDPDMLEIAAQHFHLDEGPNRRMHTVDGRRFLEGADQQWDYIYCDTYIGLSVPFHLTTSEFLAGVRDHLAPNGVFGLNLAGDLDRPFTRAIYKTVRATFPHVWAFKVPQSGNQLILAMNPGPTVPDDATLAARATELDQRYDFDLSMRTVLSQQHRIRLDLRDTPVLLDQFAPVDRLLHLDAELPALLRAQPTVSEPGGL